MPAQEQESSIRFALRTPGNPYAINPTTYWINTLNVHACRRKFGSALQLSTAIARILVTNFANQLSWRDNRGIFYSLHGNFPSHQTKIGYHHSKPYATHPSTKLQINLDRTDLLLTTFTKVRTAAAQADPFDDAVATIRAR